MNSIQHLGTFLSGKKTYLIAVAGAIYAWGVNQNLWQHDQFFDFVFAGGLAAALRHGWKTEAAKIVTAVLTSPPTLPPPTGAPAPTPPPAAPAASVTAAKVAAVILCAAMLIGCASFVNTTQKSLYTASMLSDGAMQTYAAYWKSQTNALGDTVALENQRSNVLYLSWEVGAGISVANQALQSYESNAGTNTTTSAVVSALVQTAIQNAGSFASYVGAVTGNTNLIKLGQ